MEQETKPIEGEVVHVPDELQKAFNHFMATLQKDLYTFLGNDEFAIKLSIDLGVSPKNASKIKVYQLRIQEKLNNMPKTFERGEK